MTSKPDCLDTSLKQLLNRCDMGSSDAEGLSVFDGTMGNPCMLFAVCLQA